MRYEQQTNSIQGQEYGGCKNCNNHSTQSYISLEFMVFHYLNKKN